MNGKFWMRQLRLGNLYLAIVYNGTFNMTDGPIHLYLDRDDDTFFITGSLRIGHLWLDVDILR